MSYASAFLTLIKFLPEVVEFLKLLANLTEQGVEKIEIMTAMKKIDKAFSIKDPRERARKLNEIFYR